MASFLSLPLELRDDIYFRALAWPDLNPLFQKTQAENLNTLEAYRGTTVPKCTIVRDRSIELVTPSILLLNRQITSEARVVLQKKVLTISSPPPVPIQLAKPADITEFIGEGVLQTVRFVTLRLNFKDHEPRDWMKTVENLLDVWCERNDLQSLHICVEKRGGFRGAEFKDSYTQSALARVGHALSWMMK